MKIHSATVIRAYRPPDRPPLSGVVGTTLTLVRADAEWPGWSWCVDPDGVAGWVPDRLLLREGSRATLREDYDGTELEVGKGDRLAVLVEESGWICARTEDGHTGWVPASHLSVEGKRLTEELTKTSVDLDTLIRERKIAEAALKESEDKHRALVENSLQGLLIAQGWPPRLVFANRTLSHYFGREVEEILGLDPERVRGLVHEEDREAFFEDYRAHLAGLAAPQRFIFRAYRPSGEFRWIEAYVSRVFMDGQPAMQAAVMDITERKQAEGERESLIAELGRTLAELNQALAEVRSLRGIIPICASCKQVRDDQGFWQQVETYVSARSEAEFTHSICPACRERLYPKPEAKGGVGGDAGDAGQAGEMKGTAPHGAAGEGVPPVQGGEGGA